MFREEVGLTPKQFCRVRRFLAALRRDAQGARVDWAQLPQRAATTIKRIFIVDFRRFAGVSPSVYVRERHECFPTYLTLPHKTPSPTSNR